MTHTTEGTQRPDLSDPIWGIAHIAPAFQVSVDRAREYTSRNDFPGARRLGESAGRLFWPRQEIVDWFAGLRAVPATERRRTVAPPAAAQPVKASSYRPRAARQTGRAA